MKHLNVRLLLANGVKRSRWVSYTFLQKRCSFKSFSILEENCAADIINENSNARLLLVNTVKSGRWESHTFLQKALFFQVFQHFRRKCGTDIINRTFECKTFVGKCSKKRPLGKLYLPTKAKSFQSFLNSNIILRKFLCL